MPKFNSDHKPVLQALSKRWLGLLSFGKASCFKDTIFRGGPAVNTPPRALRADSVPMGITSAHKHVSRPSRCYRMLSQLGTPQCPVFIEQNTPQKKPALLGFSILTPMETPPRASRSKSRKHDTKHREPSSSRTRSSSPREGSYSRGFSCSLPQLTRELPDGSDCAAWVSACCRRPFFCGRFKEKPKGSPSSATRIFRILTHPSNPVDNTLSASLPFPLGCL